MLFSQLPDDIFKPLAGPNRHIYQDVLLSLYPVFFDENEAEDFFPRKELVVEEMKETLGRLGRLQWVAENPDEAEEMGLFPSVPRCAEYIYARLLKTGWLEEDQDGYHKSVVMPPIVSALLESLIDISHNQKKSYGGTVLAILVQIEAAVGNPEEMGQLFIEAFDNTRRFNSHLTSIIYGLKDIQAQIVMSRAPSEILATFFDDFVTNILIADYKTLQSENNPFRFRTRILQHLRALQGKWETAVEIARHYEEGYGLSEAAARNRLMDHIQYLVRSFELVDRRLAKIDQFRSRLEDRVAETVRYLDKSSPGVKSRLVAALERIGTLAEAEPERLTALPTPDTLLFHPLLAPNSVRLTARRRPPVQAQVLRESSVSHEVVARSRALTAYMARRRVTPEKIADYIERQLAGASTIDASQMTIETAEEYVAFTHIRRLARLGAKGEAAAERYLIAATEENCRNRWLESRGFTITRRSS